MNISKKILILLISCILLLNITKINIYAIQIYQGKKPINIDVFLHNFNDPFLSVVKTNLENIQKQNENKVNFTFFDAQDNQLTQNESIDSEITKNPDLLVINLVSRNVSQIEDIIIKVIQKNIPLIIYASADKNTTDFIKNYNNAVIIGTDNRVAGAIQGKILVDTWNSNKETLDKNKDDIMQYVLFQGPSNSSGTLERTKYSLLTLNDSGIKTEQLSSITCNWNKDCAQTAMESLFLTTGNKIEAIISNNDAMAIGAIKALQKYGFNKGDNSKYIPVVGVDGLPEAKDLINQGFMTGTVMQDFDEHAKAIYSVGMNMISGANPIANTNYSFDETGITIRLPPKGYVK